MEMVLNYIKTHMLFFIIRDMRIKTILKYKFSFVTLERNPTCLAI